MIALSLYDIYIYRKREGYLDIDTHTHTHILKIHKQITPTNNNAKHTTRRENTRTNEMKRHIRR